MATAMVEGLIQVVGKSSRQHRRHLLVLCWKLLGHGTVTRSPSLQRILSLLQKDGERVTGELDAWIQGGSFDESLGIKDGDEMVAQESD